MYHPGYVWCIRSHQSSRKEWKARQRLAQCNVELFNIQDLWNYMGGRNLLHRTRGQRSRGTSCGSGGHTDDGNMRLVDDSSWYSLWFRTVGSLGLTR